MISPFFFEVKMKIKNLPLDDNINGWSAILPARVESNIYRGIQNSDWLVIGAGFAGLSFARQIAENHPEQRVIILEAGQVGDNASGRNSGFVIDLPHNIGTSTAELAKAANYRKLLQAGIADLEQIVTKNNIQCDWEKTGKYHCIVDPEKQSVLSLYQSELDALSENYTLLDRAQLTAKLGTSYYASGIYTPNCVLLNPAALVNGLANHLPENIELYEHSPAINIKWGHKIVVNTPYGEINTKNIMVATNGCARNLPQFSAQLVALTTFATLTQPLTAEQQQRIGNIPAWGMTPANAIAGATFRYTRDHRILIRQHIKFAPDYTTKAIETARVSAKHRELLLSRFPQLDDLEFAHTWSGMISVTRNGAPGWGKFGDNTFAAVGCNGAGVSKQTIAGKTLADLASGIDNPLIADMQALEKPNYLPPRPLLDLGVNGFIQKERWFGRSEF